MLSFTKLTLVWIPRKLNRDAHRAAKQACKQQLISGMWMEEGIQQIVAHETNSTSPESEERQTMQPVTGSQSR
jgi:hypothetical protein